MELPKILKIGIYNSQKSALNTEISHDRKTTMFEIELPADKGGISYINENAMAIVPNMIICAKPGQIRHTKFPFKCYYIHICLENGLLYDTLMNTPEFLLTENCEYYKEIFVNLYRFYDDRIPNNEIMIQSLILELIYSISKEADNKVQRSNIKPHHQQIIAKSLKYIEENLSDDLSLEKVATAVQLSPIHFHNCFKATVGKTLRDYVEEQRINKAQNLLLSTEDSLTEIAFECGFSSQSYFSYVFKRRMKKTPREYAQEVFNKYEI